MLSFQNVCVSAPNATLLQNISFSVTPGEMLAVVGSSGAGKSTLFRVLTGERRISSGSVQLENFQIETLNKGNLQRYRRQIGVVFQDFRLLRGKTVFENIAFVLQACGITERISEKVQTALHAVGLWERRNSFPQTLSGGEKQRVAIARALVHDPHIIIADEPTGNLDPRNTLEIATIFRTLHEEYGITLLFSTHDPALLEATQPRILLLEKGTLKADTHDVSAVLEHLVPVPRNLESV